MRPRDRIAAASAVAVVFVALFALGSAPRWAACTSAALAVLAVLPYVASRRRLSAAPPLLIFIGIATLLTLLQVIPLPGPTVGLLSPARYTLAVENAEALGRTTPGWIALSYDPPSTLVELAKLFGYLGIAYTCLRVAGTSTGRRWLVTGVAAAGIAVAITAFVHNALGAKELFGVYRPKFRAPAHLSPLLNPNHLAGLMALITPVALGLAVRSTGTRRIAWVIGGLSCAGVGLLTESRGGAAALVVGVTIAAGLLLIQRRRGPRDAGRKIPMSVSIAAGITAMCVLTLLAVATAGGVAEELAKTDVSGELEGEQGKVQLWQRSATLVRQNRWTGVGRGAFEYSFTRFNPEHRVTFSHLENEYLQAVADWGIPGAAALAIALITFVLGAARRWNLGPLEAGITAGLIAFAMQSVADFGLELPGVAIPTIALAAVLLPAQLTTMTSAEKRNVLSWRAAAMVAGAASITLAATALARSPHADGAAIAHRVDAADADVPHLVDRAIHLFEKHPSDYVIAGSAARALYRARDPRAVKLINRALYLNPRHPGLHHVAAQMLTSSQRPKQALVEYAAAIAASYKPAPIIADLLRRFPDTQVAADGLPLETPRTELIARTLARLGRTDVALAYARRLSAAFPNDHAHRYMLAAIALREKLFGEAVEAASAAVRLNSTTPNVVMLGRSLIAAGRASEGEQITRDTLENARSRGATREYAQLLITLADIQMALEKIDDARASLTRAAEVTHDSKLRASAHARLADVETRAGNVHQATWHRQRANQLRSQ